MRAITLEETQFVSVRLSSGRLEDRAVQGINVQGVSDGLVSLLFLSNHVEEKKKKRKERRETVERLTSNEPLWAKSTPRKSQRDRNKRPQSNNDRKANRRWNRWKKRRKKKMNREKVLDIAIKQAANPTNWGLNFFRTFVRGYSSP